MSLARDEISLGQYRERQVRGSSQPFSTAESISRTRRPSFHSLASSVNKDIRYLSTMLPLRRLTLLNLFGVRGPPPVHDGARTETELAPTPAPDAPSPLLTRDVFRITEIPITATAKDLSDAISLAFAGEQITLDDTQTTLCPSPDQRSQTAIVQFQPGAPRQLINLKHRDVFDELFVGGRRVGIDKDFHGLTQMYQTSGLIKAE